MKVFSAKDEHDNVRAIKIVNSKVVNDEYMKRQIVEEKNIHLKLDHDNIIKLFDSFEKTNYCN